MPTAVCVSTIIELLEEAVKKEDPRGMLALAEWATITIVIAQLDHVMHHVDPAALQQAVQDAAKCNEGAATPNMH